MALSVNEQLRSEAVKHSVYLQRYSNNTARKMLKLMAAVDGDIVAQLQKLDAKIFANPNTIERLNGLLTSIRVINKDVYNQLYNALKDDLSHLSSHELDYQVGLLNKVASGPLDITGLEVSLNRVDAKRGLTLVNVDISKFDKGFAKDRDFYVGPLGEGGIGNRYANVQKYITDNKSFEASTVGVSKDGTVMFENGRHRYAAIRDAGNSYIPVAMDAESLKYARKMGYISEAKNTATYSIDIPVVTNIPASATVYAATVSQPFQGKLLREWVDGMEAGTFDRLKSAIRIGVVEGETVEKIVQRVKGTRAMGYADGVLEISRRSAEALVRTAVSHTVNSARSQVYQANESIMKGVQWVSTLDGRTSAVCQSRDGTVYPVNSGPRPPAHINCRSSTCPVIKSWQELGIDMKDLPEGTRASMNGQVSEKETYQSWLGKQSAAFQDDVLGPTKGKLFREGGVTLDRFVDRNGASLTIDQLRAKEAPAFKRAGV